MVIMNLVNSFLGSGEAPPVGHYVSPQQASASNRTAQQGDEYAGAQESKAKPTLWREHFVDPFVKWWKDTSFYKWLNQKKQSYVIGKIMERVANYIPALAGTGTLAGIAGAAWFRQPIFDFLGNLLKGEPQQAGRVLEAVAQQASPAAAKAGGGALRKLGMLGAGLAGGAALLYAGKHVAQKLSEAGSNKTTEIIEDFANDPKTKRSILNRIPILNWFQSGPIDQHEEDSIHAFTKTLASREKRLAAIDLAHHVHELEISQKNAEIQSSQLETPRESITPFKREEFITIFDGDDYETHKKLSTKLHNIMENCETKEERETLLESFKNKNLERLQLENLTYLQNASQEGWPIKAKNAYNKALDAYTEADTEGNPANKSAALDALCKELGKHSKTREISQHLKENKNAQNNFNKQYEILNEYFSKKETEKQQLQTRLEIAARLQEHENIQAAEARDKERAKAMQRDKDALRFPGTVPQDIWDS